MKKLIFLFVALVFVACSPRQVTFNNSYNYCGDGDCQYGSKVHTHISLDQVLW